MSDEPILKNGADLSGGLASQPASSKRADFQFEVPDWTRFRSADTLAQKAGVRKDLLRRLVLKELTDNALDSGAREVLAAEAGPNCYVIRDDGPGIEGGPEAVARLFSVNRPLLSSKLWRLPSRGAMGNGLRVVVGAVAASDGRLRVTTCGRRLTLAPQADGSTAIVRAEAVEASAGTTVEITFGDPIPADPGALEWAQLAIGLSDCGESYTGRPSPWWYDTDAFYELLQGAGDRLLVREFVEQLDGCTGAKAGKITKAFRGSSCHAITREQALELLMVARGEARPVTPARLGQVGRDASLAYACQRGTTIIGGREPKAQIPFVVEAWARAEPRENEGDSVDITMAVNRTPAVAPVRAWRSKGELRLWGCGLNHSHKIAPGRYTITVNLITPWCPVTTDGKEPDLSPFAAEIAGAVEQVARRARVALPRQPSAVMAGMTHKDLVLRNLDKAVDKASGGGVYRFSQRQLFYVLRPTVMDLTGKELNWDNFVNIITNHEDGGPGILGMYRDPRGTLYHPHRRESISLGTIAVEQYERPDWTFSQILYCEKEGLNEVLKAAGWPEQYDCALLSSKGYGSRAVRDVLDFLGDNSEPIKVFCIHDADADGTMIFQSLQEATRARGRRRVEIVNLGLEAWEAKARGMAVELVEGARRRKPVADYVTARSDAEHWTDWLQTNRVELNEFTAPEFIEWLNDKMAEHSAGKVLPPTDVIAGEADRQLVDHVERAVKERVLREAGISEQVAAIVDTITMPSPEEIQAEVAGWIGEHESDAWGDGVAQVVEGIIRVA